MKRYESYLIFVFFLSASFTLSQHFYESFKWWFFAVGFVFSVYGRDEFIRSEAVSSFQQSGGYIINHSDSADGYKNSRPIK